MDTLKSIKKIQIIISLLAIVSCISTPVFASNDKLITLTTAALPPLAPSEHNPGYVSQIAKTAFARSDVRIKVTEVPGERALILANSGRTDGDLLRIGGIAKAYPNLVPIPEKVMDFEFAAFTRDDSIKIKSIADLKNYSVAYVTGWKFYEKNVTEYKSLTKVNDLYHLMTFLEKGRADVALAERWQGLWVAKKLGIKVTCQQPPLKTATMYIYLNKKHMRLIPEIAKNIRNMKQDGTFTKIFQKTLGTLK